MDWYFFVDRNNSWVRYIAMSAGRGDLLTARFAGFDEQQPGLSNWDLCSQEDFEKMTSGGLDVYLYDMDLEPDSDLISNADPENELEWEIPQVQRWAKGGLLSRSDIESVSRLLVIPSDFPAEGYLNGELARLPKRPQAQYGKLDCSKPSARYAELRALGKSDEAIVRFLRGDLSQTDEDHLRAEARSFAAAELIRRRDLNIEHKLVRIEELNLLIPDRATTSGRQLEDFWGLAAELEAANARSMSNDVLVFSIVLRLYLLRRDSNQFEVSSWQREFESSDEYELLVALIGELSYRFSVFRDIDSQLSDNERRLLLEEMWARAERMDLLISIFGEKWFASFEHSSPDFEYQTERIAQFFANLPTDAILELNLAHDYEDRKPARRRVGDFKHAAQHLFNRLSREQAW